MRVLAVTTNASLVVALGSMMREWEVVTVRDLERAKAEAPGSSVALIDLGNSDAGLEVADQLYHSGVTIPCVVVGDKPVDDQRARVLVRPFSLEELGGAVREAASGAPVPRRPERASAPAVPTAPPPQEIEVSAEPMVVEPPAVEDPQPARRLGLVRPAHVDVEPEPAAPEPIAEPAWEPEPEPEPEPVWEPEPIVASSEAAAPAGVRTVWNEPLPSPAQAPQRQAGRWSRRRRGPEPAPQPEDTEAPLVRRLKQAAAHARELKDLVEQLPFLADLNAMADGLIGEIDRQFVCAIASVCVLRDAGYEVVAHRGLSRVEAGMVIPETQSLVSDVLKTGEGILIQPVDLAQGLVAGIGGARTEAIMVAPALVGSECYAMVFVGGDQFVEADLDRLSDLVTEAAPGLAVAQLLDGLRSSTAF